MQSPTWHPIPPRELQHSLTVHQRRYIHSQPPNSALPFAGRRHSWCGQLIPASCPPNERPLPTALVQQAPAWQPALSAARKMGLSVRLSTDVGCHCVDFQVLAVTWTCSLHTNSVETCSSVCCQMHGQHAQHACRLSYPDEPNSCCSDRNREMPPCQLH